MIVVAVSGGVDSMVLLDYLYQEKKQIVVAHVNYQKRTDSFKDALIIKEYLKGKDILFEQFIVEKEEYNDDNFQAQARRLRYAFFEEVAQKYGTNQVYVAHHLDDFLETYLFKKNRQGLYDYYGIKEQTTYQNLTIVRPLLNLSKGDLREYALINHVPFHEDSSNSELIYTRNKLRSYLNELDADEKALLLQEAEALNSQIQKDEAQIKKHHVNFLDLDIFVNFSQDLKRRWLFAQFEKYDMSVKHLDDIIKKIETTNSFQVTFLDTTIVKAYDIIYILDNLLKEYSYVIENEQDYEEFRELWAKLYNFKVKEIEMTYPFIIRSYRYDDFAQLSLNYKKFRLRIKKQRIPFFLRNYLPVIEKDNQVKGFIF